MRLDDKTREIIKSEVASQIGGGAIVRLRFVGLVKSILHLKHFMTDQFLLVECGFRYEVKSGNHNLVLCLL
jgi:hypothetical protein